MVRSAGIVCGVGFSAPAACAAIRCGISGVQETGFRLAGAPLLGVPIPFDDNIRGRAKLLRMALLALDECLEPARRELPADLPVVLCLPEAERPGRIRGLDGSFLADLRREAALMADAKGTSVVISSGRVGIAAAVRHARDLMARGIEACAIVGVDTMLTAGTVAHYGAASRLLMARNSDGFIPGEAAAAVLLMSPRRQRQGLAVSGMGLGQEPAPMDSELPLRGDGMTAAVKAALADAGVSYEMIDYRIADVSGEQYRFKEITLALARSMLVRRAELDLWHPAECVGEVGAAVGPMMLAVAATAGAKGYAPGPGALLHLSADGNQRAAIVCRYQAGAR
jgi:3-oxoacyl-[acyl-carrier-protein] synthase-1